MTLNSIALSATISASTTSAGATIPFPNTTTGIRVHNASTGIAYVRTGVGTQTAVATDQFLGGGDTIVLNKASHHTHFAVILSAGTGNVVIAPCQADDIGE